MFTWTFWRDALERMVRGAATNLLATSAIDGLTNADLTGRQQFASAALHACITAVLAVLASPIGEPGKPTALSEPQPSEPG